VGAGGEVRRETFWAGECTANRKKLEVMKERAEETKAGLCGSCKHTQVNKSDRGSVFYFCRLSSSDARFPKYPRLPVVTCEGYEKSDGPPHVTGE